MLFQGCKFGFVLHYAKVIALQVMGGKVFHAGAPCGKTLQQISPGSSRPCVAAMRSAAAKIRQSGTGE
jgi:hypothetical protein